MLVWVPPLRQIQNHTRLDRWQYQANIWGRCNRMCCILILISSIAFMSLAVLGILWIHFQNVQKGSATILQAPRESGHEIRDEVLMLVEDARQYQFPGDVKVKTSATQNRCPKQRLCSHCFPCFRCMGQPTYHAPTSPGNQSLARLVAAPLALAQAKPNGRSRVYTPNVNVCVLSQRRYS